MSISAPEAHSPVSPDRLDRGVQDYGSVDTNDALPSDASSFLDAAEAERQAARERAADRMREARVGEGARGMHIGRTAIVTSMAGELLHQAHDTEATPESRRLAIQLATTALGRHYSGIQRSQSIARRYQ